MRYGFNRDALLKAHYLTDIYVRRCKQRFTEGAAKNVGVFSELRIAIIYAEYLSNERKTVRVYAG